MEVPIELITQIVSIVFFILTVYFANGLVKARKIAADIALLLKETAETMELIGEATTDNQLTNDEISKIAVQAKENLNVAKQLLDEIKELAGLIKAFSSK